MVLAGLREFQAPNGKIFGWLTITSGYSSKKHNVTMNYMNYETAVVERYSTKLVGWTYPTLASPTLVSPSEIGTMEAIRKLRDALKCGSCKWVRLSKPELKDHVAAVDERKGNGEAVGKKQKERSDKGKSRKRKATESGDGLEGGENENGEDGEAPPAKKKKPTAERMSTAGTDKGVQDCRKQGEGGKKGRGQKKGKGVGQPKSREFLGDSDDDPEEG
jgi:hypothetical protein